MYEIKKSPGDGLQTNRRKIYKIGREPTGNASIWPCHSKQGLHRKIYKTGGEPTVNATIWPCHSKQGLHRKLHLLNLIVQVIKVWVLQGHFARDSFGRIID